MPVISIVSALYNHGMRAYIREVQNKRENDKILGHLLPAARANMNQYIRTKSSYIHGLNLVQWNILIF